MRKILDFITENYVSSVIIVVLVVLLLVIIKIKNPPKPESKIVQQVVVESLDNIKLNPVESFCESYLANYTEFEGGC
jgi:hypothetical protein